MALKGVRGRCFPSSSARCRRARRRFAHLAVLVPCPQSSVRSGRSSAWTAPALHRRVPHQCGPPAAPVGTAHRSLQCPRCPWPRAAPHRGSTSPDSQTASHRASAGILCRGPSRTPPPPRTLRREFPAARWGCTPARAGPASARATPPDLSYFSSEEIDAALHRDRPPEDASVPAQICLCATDGGGDIAEARVVGVRQQVLMDVAGYGGRAETK